MRFRNVYKYSTAISILVILGVLTSCKSVDASGGRSLPSQIPHFVGSKPGALAIEELLQMPSVISPDLSPDGKSVVFIVNEPTLDPKGKTRGSMWIVESDGVSAPQIVSNAPANPSGPKYSPDGRTILCVSSQSGSAQAWSVPLNGGDARQITKMENGIADPAWSPDGRFIAFASDVNLKTTIPEGLQAKLIDKLLFRHWTEWRDAVRTHTFVTNFTTGATQQISAKEFDAPGFSLGGPTPYAFSRDSKWLYYTQGAEKNEAISTDFNLYVAPVDGSAPGVRLTKNTGWDGSPSVSPDGKYVAFRSQATDGFESDRFTVQLLDTKTRSITQIAKDIDRWIDEIVWSHDSKTVFLGAEDEGTHAIWRAPVDGGASTQIVRTNISGLTISPDSKFLVGRWSSLKRAGEVARINIKDGSRVMLTKVNDAFFTEKAMGEVESVWIEGAERVPGARGSKIQGWLVTPPNYKKGTKAPFILMIHGGPQQAWLDNFGGSGMWNPQIYAAQGYVVLALNPHGSTGFGQEYTNQISGDWGGAVYEDCMRATDWMIAQGYADPARMAAIGASFGGYMVDWILGHTDRFKALVSHAGVYNLDSMYGVTEELWFPEYDLKGRPWDSALYRDRSPHVFGKNFKTPTLVTHGELDYRVPIGEGIQLFTTLQRLGVPSKFLYFPDEGHWLLKARNRELWLRVVFDWLNKYVRDTK
ncbi:MAG: prolyl oligopeptidase family serine peptidase [Planctomycetota bacterium]